MSLQRPGLRILVTRKTRESLTESVLVTYEQEVLPLTGHRFIAEGTIRRVRQSYRYPNGTEWIVGGLDKPSKILSTSYDLVFANEAIELLEEDWETLQSRIGRPDRAHGLNAILGDTNPGDPSHWLKQRCDAGRCELWTSTHKDNPAIWSEGGWTEKGEAYLARLGRLTGNRRKRLFEGVWAAGEGQWFETFSDEHVTEDAEFDPRFSVYLAVDCGVHTGAVWFQVCDVGGDPAVNVFADYYAFNKPAFANAMDILAVGSQRCNGHQHGVMDPAGRAANPVGPTVYGEYARAGLSLQGWPVRPVVDGLGLIESFVAVDPPALTVHPRCKHLIDAFNNYKRAKRGNQFIDKPEDPAHPYEDLMDALRGGLTDKFPQGRRPEPKLHRMRAGRVF